MEENNNLFNENPSFAPDQEPLPATQPFAAEQTSPQAQPFAAEQTSPQAQPFAAEQTSPQSQPFISEQTPPQAQSFISEQTPPQAQSFISEQTSPQSQTFAAGQTFSQAQPFAAGQTPSQAQPFAAGQTPSQAQPFAAGQPGADWRQNDRPTFPGAPSPQGQPVVPPHIPQNPAGAPPVFDPSQPRSGTANPYGSDSSAFPPAQPDNRKPKKTGLAVFCVALAVVVLFIGLFGGVSLYKTKTGVSAAESGVAGTVNENAPQLELNKSPKSSAAATGKALTPVQIYEKIAPSIVAVKLYSQKSQSAFTSGSTDSAKGSAASEGTGVIWKVDDTYTYVLTCAHVISEKDMTAVIETENGARYDAEIVGYDARTDVGVLRVKQTNFTAAEFGDSDALAVGDPVYAIGNPGGSEFFGSFTDGIVSAIGRTITSSIGYDMVCIQHNAAISPGNSGGPLLNEYGQVIGINSSKIAATEFEGISFAVPITQAKDIIDKVTKYGYVPGRPKLGISYVANDSSSISSIYSLAVQMKGLPSGSLVIAKIEKDSDLVNTDVNVGDMITAVNGKNMDKADVLLDAIANAKVGDTLKLSIFRIQVKGGRYTTSTFDVEVKLIEETNNQSDEEETTRALTYEDIFGF